MYGLACSLSHLACTSDPSFRFMQGGCLLCVSASLCYPRLPTSRINRKVNVKTPKQTSTPMIILHVSQPPTAPSSLPSALTLLPIFSAFEEMSSSVRART